MLRTWYVAGLAAGLAVFLWGGLAHMALGLGGESTFKQVPADAMNDLAGKLKDPGLYVFPYSADPNELNKLLEKHPYGMLVYAPPGTPFSMGESLAKQAVSDLLACLVAAWLLSLALPSLPSFVTRIGFVMGLGVFSFLVSEVPLWNWYRFPLDFTAFAFAFRLTATALAGTVLAWCMGRSGPAK